MNAERRTTAICQSSTLPPRPAMPPSLPLPLPHCLINCTVVGVFLFCCCCCWFSFGWRFNSLPLNVDAMLSTAEMRSGRCCSKSCGFLSRCPGPSLPPSHVVFFFPPPACSCLFFSLHFLCFLFFVFTPCCFSFYSLLVFNELLFIGAEPDERRRSNVLRATSFATFPLILLLLYPTRLSTPILTSYTSFKLFRTHVGTGENSFFNNGTMTAVGAP